MRSSTNVTDKMLTQEAFFAPLFKAWKPCYYWSTANTSWRKGKKFGNCSRCPPIPRPDAEKGDEGGGGGGDKEEMETLMNGNSEEGGKGGESNGEVHVLSGTKTSKIEVKNSRRIQCVSSFALPCILVYWCAFNLVKAANWSVHSSHFYISKNKTQNNGKDQIYIYIWCYSW